jgi:dTDP-4-amino-4,6-dideoxygalactose transaminase
MGKSVNIHNPLAPVPVIDLQAQRAHLEPGMTQAVQRVLEHGRFVLGPEVAELEAQLAAWSGAHCVTCGNGTDALELALWSLGVGTGDAVILPAFTFAATAEAVIRRGATPVFADVAEASCNLDPASAAAALAFARRAGLRPRAVIAVDLYGLPADYAALTEVADAEGATVIADAAQSFGARQGNRPVGSLAPLGATSFYPSKPLGCYGDGGAVFAADAETAQRLRLLARHGQGPGRYNHVSLGMNSRLDTIQAAVLLRKLAVLAEELPRREARARRYDAALEGHVTLPPRAEGSSSAWACYTLRHPERDRLARALEAVGVQTAVHYPRPLNRQPAFAGRPTVPGGVPVSERLAAEVLSLPLCAYLSEAAQERVIAGVLAAI